MSDLRHSPPASGGESKNAKKQKTTEPEQNTKLNLSSVLNAPTPTSSATPVPAIAPEAASTAASRNATPQPPVVPGISINFNPESLAPPPPPTHAEILLATPRDSLPVENLNKPRRSSVGVTAESRLSLQSISEGQTSLQAGGGGGDGQKDTTQTGVWTLKTDEKGKYYLHNLSGESRWAHAPDDVYMEVLDPSSGCIYLEHSVTGDTKWIKAEKTVWSELKDPVTKKHYFYSSEANDSQWLAPEWIDYICDQTGCLYYYNTKTEKSSWTKPENFTTEVAKDEVLDDDAAELNVGDSVGAAAMVRNSLPLTETPRNLPLATPRLVSKPSVALMSTTGGASKRGPSEGVSNVEYSMNKRPKTAYPTTRAGVATATEQVSKEDTMNEENANIVASG